MVNLKKVQVLFYFILAVSFSKTCIAYEKIYEITPSGEIEVKEIPQGRVMETGREGIYYDHANSLFRKLFDYISKNKINMTVPVEADIEPAKMRFFISPSDERIFQDTDTVKIKTVPERTVASLGARGSYNKKNVSYAMNNLVNWVGTQTSLRVTGQPYAVFWDGPFKLWFLKKFEIHIPVEKKAYRY